jgi:hypothetical protein
MSPLPTACRFLMVSRITDLYRFSWEGFSKLHSSRVKFTATSSKVTDSYKIHVFRRKGKMDSTWGLDSIHKFI